MVTAIRPKPGQPQFHPRHGLPVLLAAAFAAVILPAGARPAAPSAAETYDLLQNEIRQTTPHLQAAKTKSETLHSQAASLRHELVAMARHVQELEAESIKIQADIRDLDGKQQRYSELLHAQQMRLSHLLALLERLQAGLPPAIALEHGDELRAARATMVLTASLPGVVRQTTMLSGTIRSLRSARADLVKRRLQSLRNSEALARARRSLDQLLAMKQRAADNAAAQYAELGAKLQATAAEAQDIKSLLERIAALRGMKMTPNTVIFASNQRKSSPLSGISNLVKPVVGPILPGGPDGMGGEKAPGLSIVASPGASVVAPADSQVLFAGRYHNTEELLILETLGGYDLVLSGLDRIDVRPGDQLLVGEPLGRMPMLANGAKLYFEVRQNGKGVSPAPWLGIDLKKAKKS